jgi:hypothetical protein
MSKQNEWNVWTARSSWGLTFSILPLISDAALSEKVRARIWFAGILRSVRWRFFSVMTLVLPEPGPVRMSWKPSVATAVCWEGLKGHSDRGLAGVMSDGKK